jgi:signal transduction histidine kinase
MNLKVLYVEDSPEDAALVERELRRAGFAPSVNRVETADAMRAALQDGEWDIVLSDYNLPEFSAPAALRVLKDTGRDLPLIIVSGTVGEDVAVGAMLAGANDYVMKSSLRRLGPSIQRELKEAQARRERHTLQLSLREAQKMEVMGQLAGGIAHDFNNLLTVIISFSRFALEDLPADSKCREDLTEVVSCADRAATLVRQLLAFSRRSVFSPQPLDVNHVLASSSKMLKRLVGEHIDLVFLSQDGLWPVIADPGLIEQMAVNLIVNARDAMPRGGKLTVETRNVDAGAHETAADPAHSSSCVMIAISDTGTGIAPEVLGRIFEPFFTTKPPGSGTGLGLATVHGIVKQLKGDITVYSAVGRGTSFKVYIPRATDAELHSAQAPAHEDPDRACTETVLLVEDEEGVRNVARRALESKGYVVIEAQRPGEALTRVAAHMGPLDLIITDLVMPEMSGPELVERLTRLRPGVPVLFMSGYASGALTHQGVLPQGSLFVQKPFTPASLLRTVNRAVESQDRSKPS